jgi:undecaprenyl phosphate N,N'-diacetylbacillosamine 1-phosphate transferase
MSRRRRSLLTKRALDLVGSVLALTVLAIPLLIVAVIIKIDSPGPVFFRMERVGKDGRRFTPWKFRTMTAGAPDRGLGLAVSVDDSRITRVGNFLRVTSIDELPQLIDVLLGGMSLVGPRPTLPHQVERYNEEERKRLRVKPGITGLAAISGRNSISWERRIEYDIWYVEHWSIWLDLKILAATPWKAFVTREGLYGVDGVNVDFKGDAKDDHEGEAGSR